MEEPMKFERDYSEECDNFYADTDLFYLLLSYSDRKNFRKVGAKSLHKMTVEEITALTEEALEYFKHNGIEPKK